MLATANSNQKKKTQVGQLTNAHVKIATQENQCSADLQGKREKKQALE
jgi:hypothetical protein